MNFLIDFINFEKIFSLINNIKIKDVIDMMLLSILIFIIISIISKTNSYKIIFGFIAILILFLYTSWSNLYLTNNFLQFILPFIILSLAIIFQKEFRVLLEQVSIILPKRKKIFYREKIINDILKAVNFLAQNKIGATLVLEKNVNLNNLIYDGKLLDSELNSEIIISIFNKNSPLHDGAVIIKDNKIKYASAYLPLSENNISNIRLGTRHKSALGLSEISDAIVIIISEESGNISVAENCNLIYKVSYDYLKEILLKYYSFRKKSIEILKDNLENLIKTLSIFLISVIISLSGWIINNYNKIKIQKIIEIPIEFANLKDGYIIKNINYHKINILISGDENNIKNEKFENVKVKLALTNFEPGYYNINVNKDDIFNLPKDIEILQINPDKIKFQIIEIPKEGQ
ncbi:MAG: hypothetical protein KatS3mg095_0851 [Candidatus Parcubacteria bacterium]|nr:MAG: hypothetical protein KatS3mg095_0851 [Candidatus Parcubacteria bacterium]